MLKNGKKDYIGILPGDSPIEKRISGGCRYCVLSPATYVRPFVNRQTMTWAARVQGLQDPLFACRA